MARRKTPNENIYLTKAQEMTKRILKLAQQGEDITELKLPKTPDTFTQKTLKELDNLEPKIRRAEEEYHRKVMGKKRAEYDKKSGVYKKAKNKIRKPSTSTGNPKGNPQNLQHKGNPQNLQHKGRPKGSKNKSPYHRKSIRDITPNEQNTVMSDEIMYKELWGRLKRAERFYDKNIIEDFFHALEQTYGKYGMIDMIREAEEEGIKLTDEMIYYTNLETQLSYIHNFTQIMDVDDYQDFKDYFYQLSEIDTDNLEYMI